jgi:hypothetical protein
VDIDSTKDLKMPALSGWISTSESPPNLNMFDEMEREGLREDIAGANRHYSA